MLEAPCYTTYKNLVAMIYYQLVVIEIKDNDITILYEYL